MEYQIIEGKSARSDNGDVAYDAIDDLASQVDAALAQGWRPIGGVAWDGERFLQAMVREEVADDAE